MTRALVSLGANLEPRRNLPAAARRLAALVGPLASSRVYISAPVGAPGSPPFLNAAVAFATALPPAELKLAVLRPVEAGLGRERSTDRNAARPIDLDLALYGDLVLADAASGVVLPDPDILRFAHVAVPLADLAPDLPHPVTGEPLAAIAARLAAGAGLAVVAACLGELR